MDAVWPYLAALLPTAGLLWLFWVLMKHILEGDRRERAAQREWEAALDAHDAAGPDRERGDQPGPSPNRGQS